MSGYRVCDGCGRYFIAGGDSEAPMLYKVSSGVGTDQLKEAIPKIRTLHEEMEELGIPDLNAVKIVEKQAKRIEDLEVVLAEVCDAVSPLTRHLTLKQIRVLQKAKSLAAGGKESEK